VLINPLEFGYQIWAIIEIDVDVPRIRSAAQRLAAVPELYLVGIMTRSPNVLAAGVFRSNAQLLDFITNRMSKIPGIKKISTSYILDVVKRTKGFGIPDDLPGNGGRQDRTRLGVGKARPARR